MLRSSGQFVGKVYRAKMLKGQWHKHKSLCLCWNMTGNYCRFLSSLANWYPSRKKDGLYVYPWFILRRSWYFPYRQEEPFIENLFFFCQNKSSNLLTISKGKYQSFFYIYIKRQENSERLSDMPKATFWESGFSKTMHHPFYPSLPL